MAITDTFNATGAGPEAMPFKRPKPFYELWQARQGIPTYSTFHVQDMAKVELAHWGLLGVDGCFMNLEDPFIVTSIIIELKPGQKTRPIKHMFETWCYVVHGQAARPPVEQRGRRAGVSSGPTAPVRPAAQLPPTSTATWTAHKPARHPDGDQRAGDHEPLPTEEFMFENPFVFKDRFRGEKGYLQPIIRLTCARAYVRANWCKDVRDVPSRALGGARPGCQDGAPLA